MHRDDSKFKAKVDLRKRELIGELMDQEDLSKAELAQALSGLARLNLISLAARQIWNQIKKILPDKDLKNISILDLACGGGDTLFSLEKFAEREGIAFNGLGLDINKLTVGIARDTAVANGSKVNFKIHDAVKDAVPEGYDVIICSLFLHHLSRENVVSVLENIYNKARVAIVISDLRRTQFAYFAALVTTRMLSRSRIVHVDGPLSIRAAFNEEEIEVLAEEANLKNFHVFPVVGCRYILAASKLSNNCNDL